MQVINYHKQVMPHKESKKSIQILPKIRSKIYSKSAQKSSKIPPQKSTLDAYFFRTNYSLVSSSFSSGNTIPIEATVSPSAIRIIRTP